MLLRSRSIVLFAAIMAMACRGRPGPGFSGGALLALPPEAEAAHDELLRSDLGRADSVASLGVTDGLSSIFADDVIYLRDGLPILRGKSSARAVVAAEAIGRGATIRWQPVRAETSTDRASGYTYGYAIYGIPQAGATSIRVDRYIAFWRKMPSGWRIAAYAETYGAPPAPLALPAGAEAGVLADVPMSRTRAPVDVIRAVDTDFSRDATRMGTGAAFGRYAAEDAQIFSPLGEAVTGPGAITGLFSPPVGQSSFTWYPVEGELSKSGDLGFTVGNAVFTGEREDGKPVSRYSKYLTVWKRQRDGGWRYVVDGGSPRPATAPVR